MKILIQNCASTLAIGEIENPGEYRKVVKIDSSLLKDLIKMMAPFEPSEYEVGVVGVDTLGFKPVSSSKNVSQNTIFLLATLAEPEETKKAPDPVVVDPDQTEIITFLPPGDYEVDEEASS